MSRHAPGALCPPTLPPCLCCVHASCCATCGGCGGPWCREVCFDFLSPFPLEDTEGGPPCLCPVHQQRAQSDSVRPVEKEGLRILCVHACGAPCACSSAMVPQESESSGLGGVRISAVDRAPISPPPCLKLLLETPQVAVILGEVFGG